VVVSVAWAVAVSVGQALWFEHLFDGVVLMFFLGHEVLWDGFAFTHELVALDLLVEFFEFDDNLLAQVFVVHELERFLVVFNGLGRVASRSREEVTSA